MSKKVIYKYGPVNHYQYSIAVKGRIVHAEFRERGTFTAQAGIYVWAEVDKSDGAVNTECNVSVVGTGEEFKGKYHKTVIMPDGLVWHVVEV